MISMKPYLKNKAMFLGNVGGPSSIASKAKLPASEMTYIVSGGALNSTNSTQGKINLVEGLMDEKLIAKQFADHFCNVCANSFSLRAGELKAVYEYKRLCYLGNVVHFDAESAENAIMKMKRGKAAGLDNITVEHLRLVITCYIAFCANCSTS